MRGAQPSFSFAPYSTLHAAWPPTGTMKLFPLSLLTTLYTYSTFDVIIAAVCWSEFFMRRVHFSISACTPFFIFRGNDNRTLHMVNFLQDFERTDSSVLQNFPEFQNSICKDLTKKSFSQNRSLKRLLLFYAITS